MPFSRGRSFLLFSVLTAFCSLLTSCHSVQSGQSTVHLSLQGRALGGEQPIIDDTVYLFEVNASTNGGASTNLLTTTVTTSDGSGVDNSNANAGNNDNQLAAGYFTISGDYTCPSADTLVFLALNGGNAGAGANNAQEGLAALGPCGNLSDSTFVTVNEITTVGTVSALSSFMTAYDHVGSTVGNAASLATAFNTVNEYVAIANGTAPGPSLPGGYYASDNDLRALANVVQYCVNSNGGTGSGSPCGTFFADAQGTAANPPGDTVTALLDIFADPTNNVAALFNLQPAMPAFEPTNASAPLDWTLPILQVPATPVISPSGGAFTSVQTVTITDSDTDSTAQIYYTTDGSTPSATNGPLYSGPLTVSASETVSAIDIDDSRLTSAVASASFTLSGISAPSVSLASISANYGSTTGVTLTASSNANGSVVTFGTAGSIGGSFSPATCTIASGTCSVSYIPSGTLAVGAYANDLTASFSASGSYTASSATGTLFIESLTDAESVLASFTGTSGAAPGNGPAYGNLIQASDGNFYGMIAGGGANGDGTVFKISPAGTYTLLHTFAGGATDGNGPQAGLVEGTDGNFYGTTVQGGANNLGTVFKISPTGTFTLLYSFTGAADGANPIASLVQGADGNFYGTTVGGDANGTGTVFKISPTGTFTLLYFFTGGNDGGQPFAGLVQGTDGNFYGTTFNGGADGTGTVFKISSTGTLTLLHSFTGGNDGGYPQAGLVQGTDGNFYGTTAYGGANNDGTVFKISPTGTFTLLYTFTGGNDGGYPSAGLVQGTDGNFYGTTAYGGLGYGTVFQISSTGTFTRLYSFASGTTDGQNPEAGLVQGADGNFYGMTYQGGANNDGTVFRLTASPALPGPVTLSVPASVAAGASFTLSYSVANAPAGASVGTLGQCFATNNGGDTTGWTGIKTGSATATNVSLTAPSTAGSYTYTLTCGGMESGLATLNVP